MTMALRLAKSGWWNGDPMAVLRAPADAVVLAAQYDNFKSDYESEMMKLNKPEDNA